MKNKKAVSVIISTVLLIMLVLVITIIILFWAQDFLKDRISGGSSGGKKIEKLCDEIKLSRIMLSSGDWGFKNEGNIVIEKYMIFYSKDGKESLAGPVENKIGAGDVEIVTNNPGYGIYKITTPATFDEIKVIPILPGITTSGQDEMFRCPERSALVIL